jgi:anti-anti-sigma factor
VTRYESWADSGVGIVEVAGDLTSDQTVPFHAALRTALDGAKLPILILVCSGIRRLSMGPIAVVLSTDLALRGRGGRVVLAAPDARLRRVLHLGGVTDVDAFPDLQTALAAAQES